MIETTYKILKTAIILIIKFSFLLSAFALVSNLFAFTLYHIYYGFIVGGGYFLCNMTLNIIFYSGVGVIIYIIHDLIYN